MADISLGSLRARRKTVIAAAIVASAYLTDAPRTDANRSERVEWSLICSACMAELLRVNRIIVATEHSLSQANGRGLAGQCPAGIVAAKTPVVRGAGKPRCGRLRNESPSPVKPAPSPGACRMRKRSGTFSGDFRPDTTRPTSRRDVIREVKPVVGECGNG